VPIGITEWGPLFGYSTRPNVHNWYVDQSRTMAAAVYVASILDTLLANPRVLLATYTNPIHRWYGSLLTDTDRGLIKTPSYHVLAMYRSRFETRLLPVTVDGPTFDSEAVGLVKAQRGVAEVLARATVSTDGRRLTAMLVNRSLDRSIATRVALRGFEAGRADCQVLSAASPNSINGPGLTDSTRSGAAIAPQPIACAPGPDMSVAIPPSAVVSIVLERR
jgi:alpha-L-arabinofuranosidase